MAAAASMVLVAGVVLAAVGAAELTLRPAPVPLPEIVAEPPLPYQPLAPQLADPPAAAPVAMAAEAPPVPQAPAPAVEDPPPADDTDADAPDPTPWNLRQWTRREVIRCFAELRDDARALRTSPATTPPSRPCTHL
jgi:hypothetical protein